MNDETRFENFFKLLTRSWVKHWTSRLDEGYWTEDDLASFNSYFRYSEEPLSEFSDPKINETFKKLNQIFRAIGKIFNEYFALRYKDSYGFKPELQPNEENKLHNQLRALATELRQIHENLVESYAELKKVSASSLAASGKKYLIMRDKATGDFYFNGKLVECPDHDDIYFKIFIALYEKSDASGFLSYKNIDKYLADGGKKRLDDEKKKQQRIDNGLKNLFHRTNLVKKTPDGKKLISRKRGKGLILYNPRID